MHIDHDSFPDWCSETGRTLSETSHKDVLDDLFTGWAEADEIGASILEVTYFDSPEERNDLEDPTNSTGYLVLISFRGRDDGEDEDR